MRAFLLATTALLGGTGPTPADEAVRLVPASTLQWVAAPRSLPEGAKIAILAGDPSKPGPVVARLELPAGYEIPAHRYSTAEFVTVLAGGLYMGEGDRLDKARGRKLMPGDFVEVKAQASHFAWTTEPTVIQIYEEGGSEMTYIDPSDDPRR